MTKDDNKLLREISFACNEVLKNKREISNILSEIIDIKTDLLKLFDEMDKSKMHELQLNYKMKEIKNACKHQG